MIIKNWIVRVSVGYLLIGCVSLFAETWDLRLGVAQYPEQNTLVGLELTHVAELADEMEFGSGATIRSDFSQTLGFGAVGRLKQYLIQNLAVGIAGELGYMMNQSFSNGRSYLYFFAGPLIALRVQCFFRAVGTWLHRLPK